MTNYRKTKIACYLGLVTQAIAANFVPLLFLTFNKEYQISLGNIALISTTFFFTQILVDLFCTKFVDLIGYRICIVLSQICSALGLVSLAFLPDLFFQPFLAILLSVVIYAIGSGLIEVLCSPIIEACPFKHKEAAMSLLHSFYCWGSVATIILSTLFFAVFGIHNWKWLAILWAIVPAINIYNFATCPIKPLVEESKEMSISSLLKRPLFWLAIGLMICSGASELSMAQWASAYAEAALGWPKAIGDLAGPCMFAITMGISRIIFGKYGNKIHLIKFMTASGMLCVFCYLLASLSNDPFIGLIGCVLCGFSVGIMWPGTISLSSKKFPKGGTALFALLAMAGDFGGSIGPGIVGRVTQYAGNNIRAGIGVGLVFPVFLLFLLFALNRKN